MRVVVIGGGIAGLAAALRLETVQPDATVTLVESEPWLGGKIVTERVDGLVIEGAPDSFLSRKERGVGLCEEVGLAADLVGRRPENNRSFVKKDGALHPLPAGLTGLIPTNVDALAESPLLSPEGRARVAAEVDLPPAPPAGDESVASFVTRRLGREAYEVLVEPMVAGIYAGDGESLSLLATFPMLGALELEYGSVVRGLLARSRETVSDHPPFVSLRSGMDGLVAAAVSRLARTSVRTGLAARALGQSSSGYTVQLESGDRLEADGIVLAVPAFVASELVAPLDDDLAGALAEIPYASSALVTLAYRRSDVGSPLDGYGYVVPRIEGSEVLACTWTSSKWEGRAPSGTALIRVYAGRFGGRDVTLDADHELVALARAEVAFLGITAEPLLARVHRWPRGIPQYVLGHLERLAAVDGARTAHRGLALAGAPYRGVGIPDCIRSGEEAAETVARALARAPR